jgi:hypothetical protein
MHFVKLFGGFLDSTINEEAYHIRLVWIACLLLADKNGNFRITPQALARRANVTTEEAEEALECLSSPDPDSTSPEAGGRRLQPVSKNEWTITNFKKYKQIEDPEMEREKAAERKRRSRAKTKAREEVSSRAVTDVTAGHTWSREVTECHDIEIENIFAGADPGFEKWLNCEDGNCDFCEDPCISEECDDEDYQEIEFELFANRLLDTWQQYAIDEYDPPSEHQFRKRYPEIEGLECFAEHHEAFQYIHGHLEGSPEEFVAFCFEFWKIWNDPKIKHSGNGDLSRLAGIGFPSIRWLVKGHRGLVSKYLAIPRFSPSYLTKEEVN